MPIPPRGHGEAVDLDSDIVAEFLSSTQSFQGSDQKLLDKVSKHVQCFGFKQGDDIVQAGSTASFLGIVFNGRATVRQVNAVSGEYTVQQELRVGDHFGDVAAVLGSAHPYAVVAESDTTILTLPKNIFEYLTTRVPDFALRLAKGMASRLVRSSIDTLSGPRPSINAAPEPKPKPAPSLGSSEVPEGVMTFVRTAQFDVNDQVVSLVPAETILQHRFIPLKLDGNKLTVGMVDPYHAGAIAELERVLQGIELDIRAISHDDYMATLVRLRLDSGRQRRRDGNAVGTISYEKEDQEKEANNALGVLGKEVTTLVDKIFAAGIERGASDIHIEEQRSDVKVRFRINGMLVDWNEYIPASFARGIVARIKVLSGLDITEKRRPQDGRVGLRSGRRDVDFRISTLPASRGEKVVMRMFEASNMMRPLEQIFIERDTLEAVRAALSRPYGALIVAGATGSGKSSTLYGCLNERRTSRPDTNICVVEDPIEYRLQGVTQVQVNHAVGLTFAQALRAFLRQDPDVIMVGEIRDAETAAIGLEAAMTGHLVFSSFHANNVTAAIQRLENLGCNRTMIAQAVSLVLVQRLVRRLCNHCAVTAPVPPVLHRSLADRGVVEKDATLALPKPRGCERCNQTGFAGRVAVIESLQVTDDIATALMADERLDTIERQAVRDGAMIPFRRYASFLMTRKLIAPGEALLAVAS